MLCEVDLSHIKPPSEACVSYKRNHIFARLYGFARLWQWVVSNFCELDRVYSLFKNWGEQRIT